MNLTAHHQRKEPDFSTFQGPFSLKAIRYPQNQSAMLPAHKRIVRLFPRLEKAFPSNPSTFTKCPDRGSFRTDNDSSSYLPKTVSMAD
jgi:hypothetical protein